MKAIKDAIELPRFIEVSSLMLKLIRKYTIASTLCTFSILCIFFISAG